MMRQMAKKEIAEILGAELGGVKLKGARGSNSKVRKRARFEGALDMTHELDEVIPRQVRLVL